MKDADEGLMRSGDQTREIDAAGKSWRARIVPLCIDKLQDTPPRVRLLREPKAEKCAEHTKQGRIRGERSPASPGYLGAEGHFPAKDYRTHSGPQWRQRRRERRKLQQ
jgi:hypothetical protein